MDGLRSFPSFTNRFVPLLETRRFTGRLCRKGIEYLSSIQHLSLEETQGTDMHPALKCNPLQSGAPPQLRANGIQQCGFPGSQSQPENALRTFPPGSTRLSFVLHGHHPLFPKFAVCFALHLTLSLQDTSLLWLVLQQVEFRTKRNCRLFTHALRFPGANKGGADSEQDPVIFYTDPNKSYLLPEER